MKQTLIKLISSTLLPFITVPVPTPTLLFVFLSDNDPNQRLQPLKHFVELAQLVSTGSIFSSQQPRDTSNRKTIDSLLMNSWSPSNNLNPLQPPAADSITIRAGNEPSQRLKFHIHG